MVNIISSTVFFVLVGIIVLLGIAWLTGRNKRSSQKSLTEKLASTLQRKFDKWINELNKKLRTPEDIQEEMLEALDDYKDSKINEVKNVIANITTTETNIINNLTKLKNAKSNIIEQVRKMKESNYVDENAGGNMMMQIDTLDKSIATSQKSLNNLHNQIIAINTAVAKFGNKIEMKRAEVLTLIANYVSTQCGGTIKFDIDLSDLMSDYTNEMTTIERQNKVDELANSKVTDEPETIAPSEDYIKKFREFK